MYETAHTYPAPSGIPASNRFSVTVDGQPSFVYQTIGPREAEWTAGHSASWTSFDMRGKTDVRVRRLHRPIQSAVVRPASASIDAEIVNGEVRVELDRPRKLCIVCDGDLTDTLLLFANEPETDIPTPGDPRVVWFGPGIHDVGKRFRLQPETTYYLAPGAFLRGTFAGGGDGTRVCGRGVLSGAAYAWPGHLQEKSTDRVDLVRLQGDGIAFSGITLVDSPYYVLVAHGKRNRFRDLKLLAWHYNTDGISAGPGARIEDCFLRVADDVFKPFVDDTRIRRCVIWADRAAAFQLTWNAKRDSGNSRVEDCDVIEHMPFCTEETAWTGAVFWSWHGGPGHIHDVIFDDIRIEGRSPRLLGITLERNPWSPQDGPWGRFTNLTFRNIRADHAFRFSSKLMGRDQEHGIDGVHFEGLLVAGESIRSAAALGLQTNAYVSGLTFNATP